MKIRLSVSNFSLAFSILSGVGGNFIHLSEDTTLVMFKDVILPYHIIEDKRTIRGRLTSKYLVFLQ